MRPQKRGRKTLSSEAVGGTAANERSPETHSGRGRRPTATFAYGLEECLEKIEMMVARARVDEFVLTAGGHR